MTPAVLSDLLKSVSYCLQREFAVKCDFGTCVIT